MVMLQQAVDAFKWLTVYEWILLAIDLIVLIWYTVPIPKYYRWIDFLPGAGVVVAVLSMLDGDFTLLAIAFYTLTAVLFLCTPTKIWKPVYRIPVPKYRVLRAVLGLCGLAPLVLALMFAGENRYNPVSSFGQMSYSQAFIQLNDRLAREYPFGERKKIDWEELEQTYEPLFRQAEQDKNKALYYKTLRAYLFSFRDGHIKITNENLYDHPVFKAEAGGGVGISTLQLDSGAVLVNLLLPGSTAERSGIKLGAEILSWDGKEAKAAYRDTAWSENPMATDGDKWYNQGRFMVRAPVGKEVRIAYRNKGEAEIREVTLTAYDDQYETLLKTKVKLKREDAPLEGEILSNGYGYVKIRYLLPGAAMPDPGQVWVELLERFQKEGIKGLIIDVRDNPGGSDDLLAALAGHLTKEPALYEYVSYYSRITRKFEINRQETRKIQPAQPSYQGKLAILVNHRTASSGEGLPLLAKGWSNAHVVGFTGTNGSFGVVTSPIEIEMPEGYLLQFPDGRSLDANQQIQGDSDDRGEGGSMPDLNIPFNQQTFEAKYIRGEDVELNVAVQALEAMK
ncbi:S41 family peptidase [Paenibacillus filicis]|uniref:S41 family peptidase n=1 Tax=Paenibacillus filicis TaxID=669464 RepID=A0ABU9DDR8_9BACL